MLIIPGVKSCHPCTSSVSPSLPFVISLNQTPSVICQSAGSVISICCSINNEATRLQPRLTVLLSAICLFVCVTLCWFDPEKTITLMGHSWTNIVFNLLLGGLIFEIVLSVHSLTR